MDQENTLIITKSRCPKLTGGVFMKPGKEVAEILKEWLQGPPAPPREPAAAPAPTVHQNNGSHNGSAGLNGSGGSNGSLPPDLVAIWKRMCSPRGVVAEFAKLKEAITQVGGDEGESLYQGVLSRHGVQRPSDFSRSQPARLCAKELFQAIQSFRRTSDSAPGIGVVEGSAAQADQAAEAAVVGGQQHGD
jgi:hypothetical protein